MFRFLHNVRSTEKRSGPLTAEEIQGARTYWLKEAQRSAFSAELRRATNRTETLPTSPLRDFSTFIDQEGVLRIRGRLRSDNMTYDERNPIVLPKQHRYSTLLVIDAHRMMLHAGVRDTLVQLRERYWILRGRELVKKVLRGCVTCQRFSATPASAPTGPLPCTRTTQAEPFEVVGVDFAGPLYIQAKEVTHKSYITLFTCAVTRAVHLELVPDISTRSFLLAFRRFVSRRGLCRIIYSDNALTFKRASKDLAELWKILRHSEVVNHFANATIEWRFIVERAPWWGGFYERLVRSVKVGLRKVIGRKSMDAEELSTVLCEIEAVLNSRPLTFVYNELHEGQPLTPASFLTGRRLTALPVAETEDLASSPEVLRQMWKRRKAFLNRLWETWRSEYLRELRSAYESKGRQSPRLEVGQFVLLKEQLPRLLWKMGRVEKVFCGRDGKIRACIVRTNKGGLLKRPIQLLYPLEITEI